MVNYSCHQFACGVEFYAIMTGLHVDSVRKHFGDRQLLSDIFLSCETGQIVGLLGRNGSGKSTLMKIIFGTVRAENRFVSVDGVKVGSLYNSHKMIQYLPLEGFLPGHVKVKDIISCICTEASRQRVKQNEFVRPFLKHKPGHLSGGERRLVEIVIMLHSGAKYLLLDEPFSGISPLYIEVIKTLIKEHSKDKGFIITDHDYQNVLDLSTDVVMLDNGNTKPVKEYTDLVALGYLPTTALP